MGLTYKGVEPDEITYNGQPVDSVTYDGVEVWSTGAKFKAVELLNTTGQSIINTGPGLLLDNSIITTPPFKGKTCAYQSINSYNYVRMWFFNDNGSLYLFDTLSSLLDDTGYPETHFTQGVGSFVYNDDMFLVFSENDKPTIILYKFNIQTNKFEYYYHFDVGGTAYTLPKTSNGNHVIINNKLYICGTSANTIGENENPLAFVIDLENLTIQSVVWDFVSVKFANKKMLDSARKDWFSTAIQCNNKIYLAFNANQQTWFYPLDNFQKAISVEDANITHIAELNPADFSINMIALNNPYDSRWMLVPYKNKLCRFIGTMNTPEKSIITPTGLHELNTENDFLIDNTINAQILSAIKSINFIGSKSIALPSTVNLLTNKEYKITY